MAPHLLRRAMASLWDGLAFGLTAFLVPWTVYQVVLVIRCVRLPKPGPFNPRVLRNSVDLPFMTIVIPAKQPVPLVEDAIRQAIGFRCARDRKQIVVEDGSTDNTRDIIETVLIDHQEVEFLKRPTTSGKPAASTRPSPSSAGTWCCSWTSTPAPRTTSCSGPRSSSTAVPRSTPPWRSCAWSRTISASSRPSTAERTT